MTPHLVRAGVLAPVDRAVLTAYCRAVADVEELSRACEAEGHFEAGPKGGTQRTGASRALEARERAMLRLSRELCLGPSARDSLPRPQDGGADPLTRAGDARRSRGDGKGPGPRLPSARDGPVAVQYDANEGPLGRRREGTPTPRLPSARDGPNAMDEMALPDLSQGPPRKRERNDHDSTGGSSGPGEPSGE